MVATRGSNRASAWSLFHKTEMDDRELMYPTPIKNLQWDFPGGTVVKNPPAKAGDMGSSPGPGGSHMRQSN